MKFFSVVFTAALATAVLAAPVEVAERQVESESSHHPCLLHHHHHPRRHPTIVTVIMHRTMHPSPITHYPSF